MLFFVNHVFKYPQCGAGKQCSGYNMHISTCEQAEGIYV